MPRIFAIGDIVGQPMLAHKAVHECTQIEPDWDLVEQPAQDYEVDQRINW